MNGETYIDGVGDEVLQFAGFCFLLVPLLMLFAWRCLRRGQSPVSTVPEVVHYRNTELPRAQPHRGAQPFEAPPARRGRAEDLCPICISPVEFPCETGCGHLFCTACLHGYWLSRGQSGAVRCPCCRRPITLLLAAFDDRDTEGARTSLRHISAYNAAIARPSLSPGRLIHEVPLLLRRLWADPFAAYYAVYSARLLLMLAGTAVYVLSPLDLLPDALLGPIGLLDDLLVFLGMAFLCLEFYRQHLLRSQRQS